ncbi:hypothetical protein [Mesorhizobium sp. M0146]|uniref:hypothetical protein n=1 Tax=unclassified Mesorhizobium TaxID=325217 RepID=UPI003337EE83
MDSIGFDVAPPLHNAPAKSRRRLPQCDGDPRHCNTAAIPTLEEEDARRPIANGKSWSGERTRLINRIKGILARFGICSFRLSLRNAGDRLM